MPFGYIYLITHLSTGRYYVGQTITAPRQRWNCHRHDARYRSICPIDRAIGKHGESDFVFEVISVADSKEQLDELEKLWILLTASNKRGIGFNVRSGGSIGSRHSAETKEKLRTARMAQVIAPESYKRGAEKRRGRKMPEWWKENIRKSQKGRKFTPEHLSNLRAGQKRKSLNLEWQRQNRERLLRLNNARQEARNAGVRN